MIRGKVTGRVWATKHVDSLPSGALLEIQTDKGDSIIAFDPLGCAEVEEVLITRGSVAAGNFSSGIAPIVALIVGSIDKPIGHSPVKQHKGAI